MTMEADKIIFWRKFKAKIDERDKQEREMAKLAAKIRRQKRINREKKL